MARRNIGGLMDDGNVNYINHNFIELYDMIKYLVLNGTLTPEQFTEILIKLDGLMKSGEISIHDINKNLGKLDETYMSDEFLQQMAGNTPIHSTPEDWSVINKKMADKSFTARLLSDTLKTLIPIKSTKGDTYDWEHGAFLNDGSLGSDTLTRIRSQFIKIEKAVLRMNEQDEFKFSVYVYDNEQEFDYRTGFDDETEYALEDCYVRILAAYRDDRDISNINSVAGMFFIDEHERKNPIKLDEIYQDLEAVISVEEVKGDDLRFEHGAFLSNGAVGSDSTTRIRSSDFIEVNGLTITPTSGTKVSTYIYSYPDKTFIDRSGFSSDRYSLSGKYYIKLLMAYNDDREITNISSLSSKLSTKSRAGSLVYDGTSTNNLNTKKYNFSHVPPELFTFKDVETLDDPINVQTQKVYDLYDNLVSNHSSLTRDSYGKDPDNNDMYKYIHEPVSLDTDQEFKVPEVIITSGIHGDEKGPVYSTYNLIKLILENWRESEVLEFLRYNVRIVVMPVVNPTGFNAGTRHNANDIDLNRQFPDQGVYSEGDHSHREIEAQNIIEQIKLYKDAELWIDYHNMLWRDEYLTFATGRNKLVNEVVNRTMNTVSRKWQKEYVFMPQSDTHKFGYTINGASDTITSCVNASGIKALTLEIVRSVEWDEWSQYNDLATTLGLELLGNTIMGVLRNVP